jgi:hypothetical protein
MGEFSYFKGFPKLPERKGLPTLPIRWRLSTDAFGVDAEDIPQDEAVKIITDAGLKNSIAVVLIEVGANKSGVVKITDKKFVHYAPKTRR